MEIVPCSRVGHVFHSHVPEVLEENTNRSRHSSISFNAKRTVKVWFDDYERLVYQYRPSLKKVDPGDITARQVNEVRVGERGVIPGYGFSFPNLCYITRYGEFCKVLRYSGDQGQRQQPEGVQSFWKVTEHMLVLFSDAQAEF